MYWAFAVLAAIIIFSFLAKCFVLWLSAKIIRADGGSWSNCVKLNWVYIGTGIVLAVVCALIAFLAKGPSAIAFAVLVCVVALWYIIQKTMDVLEIGFLMFILFCIVEWIIESAISGSIFYLDKFFPFMEQIRTMFESMVDKF